MRDIILVNLMLDGFPGSLRPVHKHRLGYLQLRSTLLTYAALLFYFLVALHQLVQALVPLPQCLVIHETCRPLSAGSVAL